MAVPLPDGVRGQSFRLQQRGHLVGVDGGADAVGQAGGQPVHLILVHGGPR
ncbi:hypothetical protein SHIRM173S_00423 [Streptomyces hirsutus]